MHIRLGRLPPRTESNNEEIRVKSFFSTQPVCIYLSLGLSKQLFHGGGLEPEAFDEEKAVNEESQSHHPKRSASNIGTSLMNSTEDAWLSGRSLGFYDIHFLLVIEGHTLKPYDRKIETFATNYCAT